MIISSFKEKLIQLKTIAFQLPDGSKVPAHFHVTEVGVVNKHFIDCGGVERKEEVANFQLWEAADYDHRLHPEKLHKIIELSEKVLGMKDLEIEVEYQGSTIGKYHLDFDGQNFLLVSTLTDCLAKDKCGIPENKLKKPLATINENKAACTPGGSCC
tara:strand:- start:2055 stop:2525 length:471 start_codon:yes stop_codon:yes gene_type:complete